MLAAMSTPFDMTEARLARLEQGQRAWRLAAVVLALLLAGSWSRSRSSAVADAPAEVPVQDLLRVHKLQLLDDQNRTLAELSAGPKQISGLTCFDPATGTRVSGFGAGTDGSGVLLVATKKGETVVIHSGLVNDQGVPLEKVQQALQQLQHAQQP